MRSLRYLADGKPRNREDCLDYREKSEVVCVSLELGEKPLSSGEDCMIASLIGRYSWVFKDRTNVVYEEIHGGLVEGESVLRQEKSKNNANRRLRRRLEGLKDLGVIVGIAEKREF